MKFLKGSRNVKYRFDIYNNGVKKSEALVTDASVSFNASSTISGTARFTMSPVNANGDSIDWLKDTIRPVMLISNKVVEQSPLLTWAYIDSLNLTVQQIEDMNLTWGEIDSGHISTTGTEWLEYPLGEYVLSTPTRKKYLYNVEAYDKTVNLKEDRLIAPLYIASGTTYKKAVTDILTGANITDILFDDTDTALLTDRVFEIGESKLDIINLLLSEINYEKLFTDKNGIFIARKYVQPSADNITLTYKNDDFSVLNDDATSVTDYFDCPNVFVATVSNPEQDALTSVYTNNSPVSSLSTVSRGRNIVYTYSVDNVASQDELDEINKKTAFEKSQVAETVTFSTANMPVHWFKEIIALKNDIVDGIYVEDAWSMNLKAGGEMSHTVRRIVTIE